MISTLLLLRNSNAATSKTAANNVLDLSYHQHVKVDVLAPAIRQYLWQEVNQQGPDDIQRLTVDLSSSLLGDARLKILIESLLPTTTTITANQNDNDLIEKDRQVAIQLALRMNQLTHVGITKLFQTILAGSTPNQSQQELSHESATTNSGTTSTASEKPENEAKIEVEVEQAPSRQWSVESLDLSWNDLSSGDKAFHRALNQLLADNVQCPSLIRMDLCGLGPAACRAMAKGIIQRYEQPQKPSDTTAEKSGATSIKSSGSKKLLSLHLSGNEALGDAGAATLAASIRTVVMKQIKARRRDRTGDNDMVVLEKLDLSACSIGDEGLEALSLAFETHPRCVLTLDLSNNRIADAGVTALGRALVSSGRKAGFSIPGFDELDLSNNAEIGDRGASILADCLQKGMAGNLVLRSCSIRADGAAAFGRALRQLCKNQSPFLPISLDLSGNALGVLRGKSASSGKYSASRLKSKASATTSSYMNFIGKKIRAGLKDVVGVDVSPLMGASADSDEDDEDESADSKSGTKNKDSDVDASEARCGIKALSNAFLDDGTGGNDDHRTSNPIISKAGNNERRCHVALRHCSLDHAAADALAAAVLFAKDEYDIDLVVDVSLNPVLEDEMVSALRGDGDEYYLREMAERHNEAMSALKKAQRRAEEVASNVISRNKIENSEWDLPNVQDNEDDEESWDSDADYEDEGED